MYLRSINRCSLVSLLNAVYSPIYNVMYLLPWTWVHPAKSVCFGLHKVRMKNKQSSTKAQKYDNKNKKNFVCLSKMVYIIIPAFSCALLINRMMSMMNTQYHTNTTNFVWICMIVIVLKKSFQDTDSIALILLCKNKNVSIVSILM